MLIFASLLPVQIIEDIKKETGNAQVEFLPLDLASLASVRRCAEQFLARGLPLHLLINNAGTSNSGLTEDGFELQFGANHLGHFLLTHLLLERIKASAPARIIIVASQMHALAGPIDFAAVREQRGWLGAVFGYCTSKLANVQHMVALNERLKGTGVVVHALHPGGVWTDIYQSQPLPIQWIIRLGTVTPERAVATLINPALLPEYGTESGLYFHELKRSTPSGTASNLELAEKLWRQSEEWTGLAPPST